MDFIKKNITNIKTYFKNTSQKDLVINGILIFSLILAFVGAGGLSTVGFGSMLVFSGVLFYKNIDSFKINKKLAWPIGLTVAITAILIFYAQNHFLAFKFLLTIISFFSILLCVNEFKAKSVFIASTILTIILVIFGLYEYVFESASGIVRLVGFIGYTNTFGLYAFTLGLINFAYLFKNTKNQKMIFLLTGASMFVSVMTLSRGLLVAVLASLFVLTVLFYKQIKFKDLLKNVAIVFTVLLMVFAISTLFKKIVLNKSVALTRSDTTISQTSNIRLEYFKIALDMFKQNPTGVGPGNYREAVFRYENSPINHANDPHSVAMKLLAEYGVFIIIWAYLFFELIKVIYSNRKNLNNEKLVYLFAALVFTIHSMADSNMSYPFSWILLAFVLGKTLHINNNIDDSVYLKRVKNITVTAMLLPGLIIITSGSLMINSYNLIGDYNETKINDKFVLLSANLVQFDASLWDNASRMALVKMMTATNEIDQKKAIDDVLVRVNKSIKWKGEYASQYSTMARVYVVLRDEVNYRKSLEKAVSLSRFNSYNERLALASYYSTKNEYIAVKELVLSTYDLNKDYFGSWYAYNDPEFNAKNNSMLKMLEILNTDSVKNKDRATIELSNNIINKLK